MLKITAAFEVASAASLIAPSVSMASDEDIDLRFLALSVGDASVTTLDGII